LYKLFILLLSLLFTLNAKDITPTYTLKATSFVSDFVVHQDRLYAGTDQGIIDVFDLRTQKIVHQISLPPSITPTGEKVRYKIYSVDYLNGKLLIVSSGKEGYREVWIYENYELRRIVDEKRKLLIKEARFVDDTKILFGTFGSEIVLFDSEEGYSVYHEQETQSALGDIALSKDRKDVVMGDESGEVRVIDALTSEVKAIYNSENLDNVFHVAVANNTVITAGQDRRVGVYQKGKKPYHIKSDFLVFCVGLSPSGETGVYSSGLEDDLQLFNTYTKQKGDRLVGHSNVLLQIKFMNETMLFSSASDDKILFWKLK